MCRDAPEMHDVERPGEGFEGVKVTAAPLSAQTVGSDSEAWTIGTGFFAASAGQVWLLTAAHVPIEAQPHSDWTKWPQRLWLHPTSKSKTPLELFQANGLPLFRYVEDESGMADFMAMMVLPSAFLNGGILARYAVFDLAQAAEPHAGLAVTIAGYPHVEEKWPYDPVKLMTGEAVGFNEGLVEISTKPIKGFSGGPAFVAGERLVGMTIGSEGERGRVVRASWIRAQLS